MCNTNPGTEYAVYFPDSDSYAVDGHGLLRTLPTVGMARQLGEGSYGCPRFEVHSRLNATVTPWQRVPDPINVVSLPDLLHAFGAPDA